MWVSSSTGCDYVVTATKQLIFSDTFQASIQDVLNLSYTMVSSSLGHQLYCHISTTHLSILKCDLPHHWYTLCSGPGVELSKIFFITRVVIRITLWCSDDIINNDIISSYLIISIHYPIINPVCPTAQHTQTPPLWQIYSLYLDIEGTVIS